jgi:plastocyanin
MHAAALHLVPVLAAEKSKTVFYILAGTLVLWAIVVSVAIGLRHSDFPSSLGGQRAIVAVTAVLVVATAASDVLTSGGSTTAQASAAVTTTGAAPSAPSPPAAPKAPGAPAAPASPAAGAGTSLKLAANPAGQLSYNTKQLAAKAGRVSITMTNMSPLEHNVTIAQGSTVLGATPTFLGGSKTLVLNLKPGTYSFYCSVPGHRQAGMEGTLTVS